MVHVDLVERAASDPLPNQDQLDSHPGPVLFPEEDDPDLQEWTVEEILQVKNARGRNKKQVLVKWQGWITLTWHPLEDVEDTEALDCYEAKHGKVSHHGFTRAPLRVHK
jgi:hypothetical protein